MIQNNLSLSFQNSLIKVKGEYKYNYPLSRITWFKVGGPAEVMFKPKDKQDLVCFLKNIKKSQDEIFVLGAGSNLLIRDGGLRGVVIKLGNSFKSIRYEEDHIFAGAGALDIVISRFAASKGIGGFEFLSGIPGTLGGSIIMNAGAYGREISDVLVSVEAVDNYGNIHNIDSNDISFSYRSAQIENNLILLGACLKGYKEDHRVIENQLNEIQNLRNKSQPVKRKTGGSTFKNPQDSNYKAWELIELSGCKGMKEGGAMVSDLHCNFLINTGHASAFELEKLGNEVRSKVFSSTGVSLDWEIKRIGETLEVST